MEKELVREIINLSSHLSDLGRGSERNLVVKTLNSHVQKLRILNNSIPSILSAISPFKRLGGGGESEEEDKAKNLVKLSYTPETVIRGEKARESVTLDKKDKERFLRELSLSKKTLARLKKTSKIKLEGKKEISEYKKPKFYAKISNKLFLGWTTKLSNQGSLKRLNASLRKANLSFLVTTYLSIVLFSTFIAFFVGILGFFVLLFLTPMEFLIILRNLLIIPALPIITFISLYYYPAAEAMGIEGKINHELPFITIHMSAIAGSGIEPTQIFKIIALGEEYKSSKSEFKKIVNQVNVYGYDLITALKNTARETSSKKLSELLNGMATTISSGGSISEFLDKRAETLLFEYRLDRERKTKSAETFMDIYISIVIAAPMIMTLLLVLITISGISVGLSLQQLTLAIISIVSLINIIFLVFLHLSQPGY